MKVKIITPVILCAFLLAACQSMQNNPKQTGGLLVGAGLGALAGSQIGSGKGQMAAIALGTLAGAWLGSSIGASLDAADKAQMDRTAQYSMENSRIGQTTAWRNPDSGHSGNYIPTRTYETSSGVTCREYETTIFVDGRSETATGTACRQPDGMWKIAQ